MESNKKTRGRQKISIQKIESEEDLYASFTKRRNGIYKKASELCTLCNIDIGIIIFSPTRKPFSFFHPDMDSIVHGLFNLNLRQSESTLIAEAHTRAKVEQLNQRLDEVSAQAEAEVERGKSLDRVDEEAQEEKDWWEKPIEDYTREEVGKMMEIYKDLQVRIARRINVLRGGAGSSSSHFPDQENLDAAGPNSAYQNVIDPANLLGNLYFGGTTHQADASDHGTTNDPVDDAAHLSSFGIPDNMVDLNQTIDQTNIVSPPASLPMENFPTDMTRSSSFSFPPANAPNPVPYGYYSDQIPQAQHNDYPGYGRGNAGFSPSSLPSMAVSIGVPYPPNYAPNMPYAYGYEMPGAYNYVRPSYRRDNIGASLASLAFPQANEPNLPYGQYRSGMPEDNNAHPHGHGDN